VCMCMWRAINDIVSRPWRLVEALTGFHCLRRALAGAVCAVAGWRQSLINFRLLCAVSPGHKLPTAPPLRTTTTGDRLTSSRRSALAYTIITTTRSTTTATSVTSPSAAASCSPRCRHEHSDSQQPAGCSASLPRSSPATFPLW
jgi:hypothetical protein